MMKGSFILEVILWFGAYMGSGIFYIDQTYWLCAGMRKLIIAGIVVRIGYRLIEKMIDRNEVISVEDDLDYDGYC